jgi:hypothetical protein
MLTGRGLCDGPSTEKRPVICFMTLMEAKIALLEMWSFNKPQRTRQKKPFVKVSP